MSPDEVAQVLQPRIEVDGDCWIWQGSLRRGYGRIKRSGITYQAHRYVYEFLVGPIPPPLELDHLCRRRACVNPDHLEPVTRQENHLRGSGKWNRSRHKFSHCKRGHSLEDAYVYNGSRHCRPCAKARSRQAYRQKKVLST